MCVRNIGGTMRRQQRPDNKKGPSSSSVTRSRCPLAVYTWERTHTHTQVKSAATVADFTRPPGFVHNFYIISMHIAHEGSVSEVTTVLTE